MAPHSADANVAVVRSFMGAVGAEGRAQRSALLHEDCVVHEAGGLPFSGEYHGVTGFFELMEKIGMGLTLQPGAVTLQALGEEVVVARFPLGFSSLVSGVSVETNVVEFYTVRGGLIADLDVYYKDPSAVALLLAR